MKTLEIDDSQEQVKCPRCSHTWWATKALSYTQKHQTIYCPSCCTPLKPPVLDLPYEPQLKNTEGGGDGQRIPREQ